MDRDDILVAAGWAVPIRWDGDPAHLPQGYTDSLVRSVEGHSREEDANTLVIMAAHVHRGRRGQGLAGEQWEDWTGMLLPDTADYVIPDGLSTLHIDRDNDRGTYVEPNVWMRHL